MIDLRIKEAETGIKVCFCALPEAGSMFPLLRLAAYMEKKGHSISFMTYSYGLKRVEKWIEQFELKSNSITTSDPGWTYEEMKNGIDGSGKMFGGME